MLIFHRIVFIAVILALWQGLTLTGIDPIWTSSPASIGVRLYELALSGDLLWHSSVTVAEAAMGLALGVAVGVPLGLLMGSYRYLATVADPVFMGLYSLPRVALAPLFIMWFGIGMLQKVMLAFSLVVFIFILNVSEGLRNVPPDLVDMARSMRASRGFLTRRVLLPSLLPWIFNGLRISIGLALIGAVIGELLGASRGLGWYVEYSAAQYDTTGVFTGMVVLMAIAMLFNAAIKRIEGHALRWRVAGNISY